MKAIIYVSQAANNLNVDSLNALAEKASTHNAAKGISGYLWHEKGQFLQYIEGDDVAIDNLMKRIESDARHTVVYQTSTTEITTPKFPNWHMKYFQPNQMAIEINHEKVLTNQLLFLNSSSIDDPKMVSSVWRLVDSLAKFA